VTICGKDTNKTRKHHRNTITYIGDTNGIKHEAIWRNYDSNNNNTLNTFLQQGDVIE
jgi:hypothetical protein